MPRVLFNLVKYRVWTAPGGWNVWLRPLPTARVWHVSLPAKRQMVVVWRVMGKVN